MRLFPILAGAMLLTAPLGTEGAAAAPDDAPAFAAPAVSDDDLSAATGKFTLPNGVDIALAVTGDTVVDGQLVLRTVFTIDTDAQLTVFGRESAGSGAGYGSPGTAPNTPPTGLSVSLDRQSGIQTITPTYSVQQSGTVSVGTAGQDADAFDLTKLPVTPGGPAVTTVDGTVSVQPLANGSLVALSGDRFSAANLVGQSIATAILNSANDRTLDTVTNVTIDLRNVQPYLLGSAALRVDDVVLDATRGMIR